MVMFCRKMPRRFKFRQPVEEDFLGSGARKEHLFPRHEIDVGGLKGEVIRGGAIGGLKASQRRGAAGHWGVMRGVLPDVVWENW